MLDRPRESGRDDSSMVRCVHLAVPVHTSVDDPLALLMRCTSGVLASFVFNVRSGMLSSISCVP